MSSPPPTKLRSRRPEPDAVVAAGRRGRMTRPGTSLTTDDTDYTDAGLRSLVLSVPSVPSVVKIFKVNAKGTLLVAAPQGGGGG